MAESTPAVASGFAWRSTPAGRALVCLALEPLAAHVFTSRAAPGRSATNEPDYGAIGACLGVPAHDVLRVRQVHGRAVLVASPDVTGEATLGDADAIVSTGDGRALSVRVADCVPILLADRRRRVVAAVHAGWRGTAAGVAAATVDAIERLGVPPSELVAAIGPSIGPCCYQVDARVRDEFAARHPASADWFTVDGPDRWRLDLWRANRAQLEAGGVPPSAIGSAYACTAHQVRDWYSFRREGPATGRMVAAIRRAAAEAGASALAHGRSNSS